MDSNGLLIASSEIIRFKEGNAVLFMFYNECMDFYFYILHNIENNLLHLQDIWVNEFYRITNLRINCLVTIHNTEIHLLETTTKSVNFRIEYAELFSLNIDVKKLISVPGITDSFAASYSNESVLLSYEGTVTDVKSAYGVYELDNKLVLYTAYNAARSVLPIIRKGFKLFISNVHFIHFCKGKSFLICCGLSSIKIMNVCHQQEEKCKIDFPSIKQLSIYDLLWVEKLFEYLKRNFSSLIPVKDILCEKNKKLMKNILNFFENSSVNSVSKKKFSMMQEYCSYPHKCLPFSEDVLSTSCTINDISAVLNKAKENISWVEISKNWHISFVPDFPSVIIGIFYVLEKNYFFIQDNKSSIPVLLTKTCRNCSHSNSILRNFNSSDIALMVAIQDYDLVYEKFKYKNKMKEFVYLKTSECCIFLLTALYRIPKSSSKSLSEALNQMLTIDDKILYGNLDMNKNESEFIISDFEEVNEEVKQPFLVLSKMSSEFEDFSKMYRFLVLFLPQDKESLHNSLSVFNDSFNYYETEDDFEFASLINKIDDFLDNVPQILCLCFDDCEINQILLPGCMYCTDIINFLESRKMDKIKQISEENFFSLEISGSINICKDSAYSPEPYPNSIKYYGVKEVLLTKSLPKNFFMEALLINKFYENNFKKKDSSNLNKKHGSVLCLLLRDINFQDTIYVYVTLPYWKTVGFLPGVILELYGFYCIRSQNGYLYLKNSSLYGIEVKNFKQTNLINKSFEDQSDYLEERKNSLNELYLKSMVLSPNNFMKQLCFIVKIASAEVYLVCKMCFKSLKEKCPCSVAYEVKIKVSAIIDNGRAQLMCYFIGGKGSQLLKLNEQELSSLIAYVERTGESLKYNDKINLDENVNVTFISQVFSSYCSSRACLRKIYLEYYIFPNSAPSMDSLYYASCINMNEVSVKDSIMSLYVKLKSSEKL